MNWVDIAIILILIVFVAIGFWKGLIFSMLSVFSSTINFCISIFLAEPVTGLLNKWFRLESAITSGFSAKFSSASSLFDVNMVSMTKSEMSTHVSKTLAEGKVPFKNILSKLISITPEKIQGKTSITVGEVLSKALGGFFSLIIGFIICFILIYVILWIVSLITKKAREVDGIRITDRILGVLFGLVKGFLFVALIFSILSFFNEDGSLKSVFDYINSSSLGSWIYNVVNNIVDKYLNINAVINAVKNKGSFYNILLLS